MSQIDQAFIQAYSQRPARKSADDQSAQAVSPVTGTTASGANVRLDGPHTTKPTVTTNSGVRVPTPHLQVALANAAWLAEQKSQAAGKSQQEANTTEQPAPIVSAGRISFSSPSIWSPTSRLGQRSRRIEREQPEQVLQPPAAQVAPPSESKRFISVEETLLRIDGGSSTTDEVIAEQPATEATLRLVGEYEQPSDDQVANKPSIDEQPIETAPPEETVDEIAPWTPDEVTESVEPQAEVSAQQECTDATCDQPQCGQTEEAVECEKAEQQPVAQEVATEPVVTAPDVTEPAATPPVEETRAVAKLQPVWEVDAFQWPEAVDQLQGEAADEIGAACQSIANTVGRAGKILAVASAEENAGATTLTLTLARGLAQQGLKVALLDADFDRPALAERLGVRVQDGWEAMLQGRLPIEEVCIASIGDNVTLLPLIAGPNVSATSAGLNGASLLERLAGEFDIVLVDAGQGSENVAAMAASPNCELDVAVLLAHDERRADRTQTQETIRHLQQCAIHSVQLAHTFASV